MLTLTGAGGSGKTRLAAELGRASLNLCPGGVWWVDLSAVNDPGLVPGAVVAALDLPGRGPALGVITSWLAARRALLVFDSCEHLVGACAQLADSVLRKCGDLTVLATSREALGVAGEAQWPVSSMATSDAVELFDARARLVIPDFKVGVHNLEAVTQICEHLDGIPLAIELAAARVGMMTEPEILSGLADRFRLLTGGTRTAPDRQQTMMATIDWSYRLLNEDERLLFGRLSVFRGGFTLESAQAVCADAEAGPLLALLSGLVQKSMVVAERIPDSGTRYRLLESQLAFAEDRLEETSELELMHARHYEFFRDGLDAATTSRLARDRWITRESANLWAAFGWAREHADDLGLSLAAEIHLGDMTAARAILVDVLAHSPDQGLPRAKALARGAFLSWAQGDYPEALQFAESSVAIARAVGDIASVAAALNLVGMGHQGQGRLDAAARVYEEGLALIKDSADHAGMADLRNSVGMLQIHMGKYAEAVENLTGLVGTLMPDSEDELDAAVVDSLACAQLGLRHYQAAARSWMQVLTISRGRRDSFAVHGSLEGLSCVAAGLGDDTRSVRLAAAARRMAEVGSLGTDPWMSRQLEEMQARSRSRLGPRKSQEAWDQGWVMTVDEVIDHALGYGEAETVIDAGPLSRREREVAILVASGLTNREIGERLFIAERSAEGHVERIRNKLGMRSRTEVASWAVERGLVPQSKERRGATDGPLSIQRRKSG
jgi:predicted ATPase/DNA-binding CsgD family transcriptional regulator